jgi:hypothetical protein
MNDGLEYPTLVAIARGGELVAGIGKGRARRTIAINVINAAVYIGVLVTHGSGKHAYAGADDG